jgi:TonB family protein
VSTWRFEPALVGGKGVKQLVQLPFAFSVTGPASGTVTSGEQTRPSSNGYVPRRAIVPGVPFKKFASDTYFEFQVEKQVTPRPGNPPPRYPSEMRAAQISGEVLAQFVVDVDGRAEMSSFKVLKSTHDLFTNAVMSALPQMQFNAAEVGGHKVRQLVQMPFSFSLTR